MDRYVDQWRAQQAEGGGGGDKADRNRHQPRQLRIEECKKVQVLPSSRLDPRLDDVLHTKQLLQEADAAGDVEGMRRALDRLGCYDLGVDILVESQVGPVVKKLRSNPHPAVARSASKLTEKLRGVVKRTAARPPKQVTTSSSASASASTSTWYKVQNKAGAK